MKDHVIICGLGSIGFHAFELIKNTNHQVVAISTATQDEWRWQVEANGGIFLLGDARDDNLLLQAGIKHAKAILALTEHDIVNVSIAMDARKLNPNIKIIMRMADNELGAHIKNELGIHQIFSTAQLAAPIFVSNIYDEKSIAQFTLDNINYLVTEKMTVSNKISQHSFLLNELTPDQSFPDKVMHLVAHPTDLYRKKKGKFWETINKSSYLLSPVFGNFRRFLLVVFSVIFAAALFIHWAMSLSYIDALYFVTTTVTTVGYGDFNFSQSTSTMKLFGCLLMLCGAAALAMLFSSITEIILSQKLSGLLGGRPVPKKDHVIVVGAGAVGQHLVSMLLDNQFPIVLLEDSAKDRYGQDINLRVALVDGYPTSSDTLTRANIHSAKAIVTISNDDIENLSISFAAKKLNHKLVNIIHVFSPKLADKLKSSLSLSTVLSLPQIVAPYFAAAVMGEEILLALEWKNQLIYLSRNNVTIDESSVHCLKINGVAKRNIQLHAVQLSKPK